MLNKRLEKAGSLETVHTHTHTHTPYSYKRIVGQSGERVTFRVKISFISDAKKSEKSRAKNDIDYSKKLIKIWINKKDGLLYDKESTKLSKLYDSLSFL